MAKKKEEKLPLKELVRRANKHFGFNAIKLGATTTTSYIYRRPCGIFSIDLATNGGLPVGTMVEIAGPEGAGKNLLSDLYIARSQEIFGDDFKCFLLTAEYRYDKLRAIQNGVKIALSKEEIIELEEAQGMPLSPEEKKTYQSQVGEFYFIEGAPSEILLDAAILLMESKEMHLGVIDSLASLLPEEERVKSLEDTSRMAARASMLTRFMQKSQPLMDRTKFLLLALNQARAPLGYSGNYAPAYKIPEPFAVKHGIAGRLEVTSGKAIKDPKTDEKLGKEIRWHLSKGKAGFHEGPKGILEFRYDTGIDIEADFVNQILPHCERSGAWYKAPFMDEAIQGKQALVDKAMSEPEWVEKCKRLLFERKGVRFLYREEDIETTASTEGRKKDSKRRKRKGDSGVRVD